MRLFRPLGKISKLPYPINYTFFESYTTGTYSKSLKSGRYEVVITGGGGGYAIAKTPTSSVEGSFRDIYYGQASGGSAGGFIGVLHLSANSYSLVVGGAGVNASPTTALNTSQNVWATAGTLSSFGSIITASPGTGASAGSTSSSYSYAVGTGGAISVTSSYVLASTVSSAGSSGTGYSAYVKRAITLSTAPVAASVISSINNYGRSGGYVENVGISVPNSGYIRIRYKGRY